jgi:hypothetical protein
MIFASHLSDALNECVAFPLCSFLSFLRISAGFLSIALNVVTLILESLPRPRSNSRTQFEHYYKARFKPPARSHTETFRPKVQGLIAQEKLRPESRVSSSFLLHPAFPLCNLLSSETSNFLTLGHSVLSHFLFSSSQGAFAPHVHKPASGVKKLRSVPQVLSAIPSFPFWLLFSHLLAKKIRILCKFAFRIFL